MEEAMLPKSDYRLDESDPDILVLRRQDGSFVAAFSALGARSEDILETAKEDYRELIRAQADPVGLPYSGKQEEAPSGPRQPPRRPYTVS